MSSPLQILTAIFEQGAACPGKDSEGDIVIIGRSGIRAPGGEQANTGRKKKLE